MAPKTITAWDRLPLVLTVEQVAEILGVCNVTVRKLAKKGALPALQLGPKRVRIARDALKVWMERQDVATEG